MNPWELEVDPDFERTEDEIKRDQEAEQRALRAAAIAMRRCGASQLAVYSMHRLSSGSYGCRSMLHLHTGQHYFRCVMLIQLGSRPGQQVLDHGMQEADSLVTLG